jgi:hypothetical protein
MALTPVEAGVSANVGMTDRCCPAGAAGLLNRETMTLAPHLQRLVRWDRCMQTRLTENKRLDPGIAAVILMLSRRNELI